MTDSVTNGPNNRLKCGVQALPLNGDFRKILYRDNSFITRAEGGICNGGKALRCGASVEGVCFNDIGREGLEALPDDARALWAGYDFCFSVLEVGAPSKVFMCKECISSGVSKGAIALEEQNEIMQ